MTTAIDTVNKSSSAASGVTDLQKKFITTPENKSRVVTTSGVEEEGDQEAFKRTIKNEMDKDSFLQLLITQLKNQDPMKPTENEEFAAQLAQFSTLESSQNIDKGVTQLATSMDNFMASQNQKATMENQASSTAMLGKNARVNVSKVSFDGVNPVNLNVHINDDQPAFFAVFDDKGLPVYKAAIERPKGQSDIQLKWNGQLDGGNYASRGEYSIKILKEDQKNSAGFAFAEGKVSGIRYEADGVKLEINGKSYSQNEVVQVVEPVKTSNNG